VRAVLDPNVIASSLLSPQGAPAHVFTAWLEGEFELVASPLLIAELKRILDYPKLRKRIMIEESNQVLGLISQSPVEDPKGPPEQRSRDPGDDYLIALAAAHKAVLVSGDDDLLALKGQIPVYSCRGFLDLLRNRSD